MNQIKLKRIGSQIQKDLMDICNTEAHDSLLQHITITGVEVTNDLGLARVYFTTTDTEIDHKRLEKELNDDTAGYLRNKIAERIEMRHIPKIRFKYDDSIAYGDNIERIISKIHEGEPVVEKEIKAPEEREMEIICDTETESDIEYIYGSDE